MRGRTGPYPIIKRPVVVFLMCFLALLLAVGAAPWLGVAAPSKATSVEYINEFDTPSWPFMRIEFKGTWHPEYYPGQAHGGQLYVCSGNNANGYNEKASVQVLFYGRAVKLVSARYWQCGWCEVFLDGRSRGTFNLSSEATEFGYVLFEANNLRQGFHTIRLVNLGIPGSDDPLAQEYDLHYVNVDYLAVR
jgi:hypothetical protein